MGAVTDADDDLLANVAAFGVAERGVECGLEWNGVVAHVDQERGNAGFYSKHRRRVVIERRAAAVRESFLETRCTRRRQIRVRAS